MAQLLTTVLHDRHMALGAQMVPFGGWDMPVQYRQGIVAEHLATRKQAGLFDVSHMGRFIIAGPDALPFLQHLLSNNAAALEVEESQYTMIPDPDGGAIDDAYLYRFESDHYMLVVNAANKEKDWRHFQAHLAGFKDVHLSDQTDEIAMLSLQGPRSRHILKALLTDGNLPEPLRNHLSTAFAEDTRLQIARTGYTGDPIGFELFLDRDKAALIWDRLIQRGAEPVGLGARDTLRLEAGLPLYGHELGQDPTGHPIPIYACALAKFAVSFSSLKGDYIGRAPLALQFEAFKRICHRDVSRQNDLPQRIFPIAITGKGVARAGNPVWHNDKPVGFVTSATMVPFWQTQGNGVISDLSDAKQMRPIGLALLDSDLMEGDTLEVEIRNRRVAAVIVPYHLRSEAPPTARPIPSKALYPQDPTRCDQDDARLKVQTLISKAVANTRWRQSECINLIPSEMTASTAARWLSILDPAGRYAEHKKVKAFFDTDIFYYQGTEFISEVEHLLNCELRRYLGCSEVESRVVSGQMANMAVFSALVDYRNRADRKREQGRIGKVFNNHIIKGGHLSAQPMGALRDFVARDPQTETPAVVNFPIRPENSYRIDLEVTSELLAEHRPELVILGKSMVLHPEPVAEIRRMVDHLNLDCLVMYDMAHVLGLVGPHFQDPFEEGADLVTGSTHKTYFGTQRGIVAANWPRLAPEFELWEAIERRAFPGSVSNHHLGTMVGLLVAAYEMNHFKDSYQKQVIRNAKAFGRALNAAGLQVAGDATVDFTETHQVIVDVGYAKGPEMAQLLEQNNIICNYQAAPEEEGFTAAGALRLGVAEMTRFGMQPSDFGTLAGLLAEVVVNRKKVASQVTALRQRFLEMQYCFSLDQMGDIFQELHQVL